jgi:hypothetical protein
MSNISSYPLIIPKESDLILFTETYDGNAANPVIGNPTRSATLTSLGVLFSEAATFKTLTTTGTSGVATLSAGVLNIPNYAGYVDNNYYLDGITKSGET